MKIVRNSLLMVPTLVMSLGLYSPVFALEAGVSAETSVSVTRTSDKSEDGVYTKSTTTTEVRTTSETKGDNSGRTYTSSKADGSVNENSTTTARAEFSEDHRSEVSLFVRNLLNIANRSATIGAEVRAIAHEQDDSSTTTVESMNKVEMRNSFKTFLIGSDYRNLGAIRSEIAKTDNRIARLSVLASTTASVQVRADLNAQIKLLQDDQAKVKVFVDAHENTFSLFGWFVRIFSK